MAEIILRPSNKFILFGVVAVLVIIIAAVVLQTKYLTPQGQPPWLPAVAGLLLLWPLARWVRRLTVKATITGDKLRYEAGFLSKSTRIIQLAKIQDVRVNQTLLQRMFDVGDVAIETAGEASRLVLPHFDRPNRIAEEILEASGGGIAPQHVV